MKTTSIVANNRRRAFEVETRRGQWLFPYSKAEPQPTPSVRLVDLYIDPELGSKGFTYLLASGAEGSILTDNVLDYNEEPGNIRDLLLHDLTVEALDRLEARDHSPARHLPVAVLPPHRPHELPQVGRRVALGAPGARLRGRGHRVSDERLRTSHLRLKTDSSMKSLPTTPTCTTCLSCR